MHSCTCGNEFIMNLMDFSLHLSLTSRVHQFSLLSNESLHFRRKRREITLNYYLLHVLLHCDSYSEHTTNTTILYLNFLDSSSLFLLPWRWGYDWVYGWRLRWPPEGRWITILFLVVLTYREVILSKRKKRTRGWHYHLRDRGRLVQIQQTIGSLQRNDFKK